MRKSTIYKKKLLTKLEPYHFFPLRIFNNMEDEIEVEDWDCGDNITF